MIIFDDDGMGYDVIPRKTVEMIRAEIKSLDIEPDGIYFFKEITHDVITTVLKIIDRNLKKENI